MITMSHLLCLDQVSTVWITSPTVHVIHINIYNDYVDFLKKLFLRIPVLALCKMVQNKLYQTACYAMEHQKQRQDYNVTSLS